MKKVFYLLTVFTLILVCGCSANDDTKRPPIKKGEKLDVSMLLNLQEVQEFVAYDLTESVEGTRLKQTLTFSSNPLGNDPVILELYSYNEGKSVAAVYEDFKNKKEKRPKSKDVEISGVEAYIAYPSLNMYRDGYMIVITAGSGANDEQANLLMGLGNVVSDNLEEYLSKNPSDSNLVEDKA